MSIPSLRRARARRRTVRASVWPRFTRQLAAAALVLLLGATAGAQAPGSESATTDLTLVNLDRTLRFTLLMDGDSIAYRVDRLTSVGNPITVIEPSPLGITRATESFERGLTLVTAARVSEVVDAYRMVSGKQRDIRSRARQRVFTLRSESGSLLTITVRAYADGVAFRYGFPRGSGAARDSVTGEATGFNLPMGGHAWMQPYARVSTWAPAYENDYQNGIPIGTAAPEEVGWALPMLFQTPSAWVLVTEAGLDRTSYGIHVEQRADDGVYRVRLPEEAETYGVAPRAAAITLPWSSPWRVIMVGRIGTIVESTLVTDLAQPATFTDVSWVRPGRVSWSWWSDMGSPRDYQKSFPFVDLASRMRWEYSLLDLGWPEMTGGGNAADLVDYARRRNVGLIAWYNSGGEHNQVPDAGPKDLLVEPAARQAELRRIRLMGFRGIKVDFMQSDKQYVIGLYEDILRDAATNRLVVDFHGSTIPRGWQRTYPHLLSMEAVKGSEQYGDSAFRQNAATFNAIYPFTRNVIGSMDYTPTIFGDAPDRLRNLTTNAHELALSVVFESGLQHFVSSPAMVDSQPDYVQRFLQAVPAAWDETRFVGGFPGKLAVLARRRGTEWYLGGINGDTVVATAEVPLTFLAPAGYDVGLIADGEDDRSYQFATQRLTNRDTITVELAPRGGFSARLVLRRPTGAARPTPAAAPGTAAPRAVAPRAVAPRAVAPRAAAPRPGRPSPARPRGRG